MSGDFLTKYRMPPIEQPVSTPRRIRKRQAQFARVPLAWADAFASDGRNKAVAVMCHLLHEHWKRGGRPIKVSNGFLAYCGVGRKAKWRALNKMERLGLISIERGDRKSPIVTILDKLDAAP